MNTGVIQIGNSDDKLSQKEWAKYVADVNEILQVWQLTIHFLGHSPAHAPWQNACWVFELDTTVFPMEELRNDLSDVARRFRQDSVALTLGVTEFVKSSAE